MAWSCAHITSSKKLATIRDMVATIRDHNANCSDSKAIPIQCAKRNECVTTVLARNMQRICANIHVQACSCGSCRVMRASGMLCKLQLRSLGETVFESSKNRAADPFSRTMVFMHASPTGEAQQRTWVKGLIKKFNAKVAEMPTAQLTGKSEQVTLNLGSRTTTPPKCFQAMLKSVERRTMAQAAWQEGHLSVSGLYVSQHVAETSNPVCAKLYVQTEAGMQRMVDFMDNAPANLDLNHFQEELLVKVISQNAVQIVTGLSDSSKREWLREVDDGKYRADILDLAKGVLPPDLEEGDLERLILDKLVMLKVKRTAELTSASSGRDVGAADAEIEAKAREDYMAKLDRDQSVFSLFRMTHETDRATYESSKKNADQKRSKHARVLCEHQLLKKEVGSIRAKKIQTWNALEREAPADQRLEKARMEASLGRPLA